MNKLLKYDNGLRAVVCEMPGVRSVSVGFWVGMGGALETHDINGLSHFTEHMMFKGTDELSPFDIANKFESYGANINAFTGKEATCYFFKAIDEYLEPCFDLLSQIFYKSAFDPVELDKERKVIVEEINMVEDSPEDICYDLLATANYGNEGYGLTILGPSEKVMGYSKADVDAFVKRFYTPDNIVVAFTGNVTAEQADKLIRKFVLPQCSSAKLENDLPPVKLNKRVYLERIKDFEQSNVALSFPAYPFGEKSAVLATLNAILGGGMSSRLFQSVREQKGLAYSVYSSQSRFVRTGSIYIELNISVQNTRSALEAVREEIDKLLREGITEEELNRAKVQLKSSLVFGNESPYSVMLQQGKNVILTDALFDTDKRISEINALTVDDVNECLREVFDYSKMNAAYVGKKMDVDVLSIF